MSRIFVDKVTNFGNDGPIDVETGINIPAGQSLTISGNAGNSGQVLTSNGTVPVWQDLPIPEPYTLPVASPGVLGGVRPDGITITADLNGVITAISDPGINLTDISVGTFSTPTGAGSLTYNNVSGVFTFTPPDLSPYLTSYTETDPVFVASPAYNISSSDVNNWNTAFTWGNHATQGYLTVETEPAFTASVASGITSINVSNWNSAYNWGDHSVIGYLTQESDTIDTVLGRGNSTTKSLQIGGLTVTGDLTVNGTTTTVNTQTVSIADNEITLNSDVVGVPSQDAGIEIERGTSPNTRIRWNETTDRWSFTNDGTSYYNIPISLSELTNDTGFLTSESDPIFASSAAFNITSGNITNWNAAYSWGDHASAGYLTAETETDPVFSASEAASITSTDTTNWDTAYGWGDHASAGYLTSLGDAAGVTTVKITNWDTAYGWGDHASAGYLTSLGDAAGVTTAKITNWDTAYGWGDHSSAGYLTSYTESATLDDVTTNGATTSNNITLNDNTELRFGNDGDLFIRNRTFNTFNYAEITHTGDGLTFQSNYFVIDAVDGSNMLDATNAGAVNIYYAGNKKLETTNTGVTVTGDLNFTGDLYQNGVLFSGGGGGSTTLNGLTDVTITTPSNGQVLTYNGTGWVNSAPTGGGGASDLDGLTDVTIASVSNNQLLKYNSTNSAWENWTPNYLTSESDPVFSASPAFGITNANISNWTAAYNWGDHSTQGYLTSLGDAAGVTTAKITNWDTAYGWGDHSAEGYLTALPSRATQVYNTGTIGPGSSAVGTVPLAKSYALLKIQTSVPAWVTIYTDAASRSADSSRNETTDPLPGSGVIAEVITVNNSPQIITPGTIGWNNDTTPSTFAYFKVVNKNASPANVTVTVTYLKLED